MNKAVALVIFLACFCAHAAMADEHRVPKKERREALVYASGLTLLGGGLFYKGITADHKENAAFFGIAGGVVSGLTVPLWYETVTGKYAHPSMGGLSILFGAGWGGILTIGLHGVF